MLALKILCYFLSLWQINLILLLINLTSYNSVFSAFTTTFNIKIALFRALTVIDLLIIKVLIEERY